MNQLINQLINYEAVYRTAPATPGLLMRGTSHSITFKFSGGRGILLCYAVYTRHIACNSQPIKPRWRHPSRNNCIARDCVLMSGHLLVEVIELL